MDHPTLRKGDSGPDVIYLQTLLCDVGENLTADGKFGSKTEQAVKDFQRLYRLTVDGVVGPKTWATLETATGHDEAPPAEDGPPENDAPIIPAPDPGGTVPMSLSDFNALKAADAVIRQIIKKYEPVG